MDEFQFLFHLTFRSQQPPIIVLVKDQLRPGPFMHQTSILPALGHVQKTEDTAISSPALSYVHPHYTVCTGLVAILHTYLAAVVNFKLLFLAFLSTN